MPYENPGIGTDPIPGFCTDWAAMVSAGAYVDRCSSAEDFPAISKIISKNRNSPLTFS